MRFLSPTKRIPSNPRWILILYQGEMEIITVRKGQTPPPSRQTPPHPRDGFCSGRNASYWNACLLPPTNEVWGKVMFLQVSVILSTEGGGGLPKCMLGYTPLPRRSTPPAKEIPPPPAPPPTPEIATAADGTHPTGMHVCCDWSY